MGYELLGDPGLDLDPVSITGGVRREDVKALVVERLLDRLSTELLALDGTGGAAIYADFTEHFRGSGFKIFANILAGDPTAQSLLHSMVGGGDLLARAPGIAWIGPTPEVIEHGQGGLMEVAVHPDYEKNGWIYLSLSDPGPDGSAMTKVVRDIHCVTTWSPLIAMPCRSGFPARRSCSPTTPGPTARSGIRACAGRRRPSHA